MSKINVSLCLINQAPRHEDVWGCGYGFTVLDLGTRRRWVLRFTPLPLYLRENSPWYPLDRRLSVPQSWFRRCAENNISYLCQESNPCRHEDVWDSNHIVVRILYLGLDAEVSGSFTRWSFYRWGQKLIYPSDRRLGGAQSRSECCRDENVACLWRGNSRL
jgi:hypothetical protein